MLSFVVSIDIFYIIFSQGENLQGKPQTLGYTNGTFRTIGVVNKTTLGSCTYIKQ